MGQDDVIETAPKVAEEKIAAYPGAQLAEGDDGSGCDMEKHVVQPAPELKRRLKSRHLQMIAIGMLAHLCIPYLELISGRWHHRNRSLHW
jgi:amino acid transporter